MFFYNITLLQETK